MSPCVVTCILIREVSSFQRVLCTELGPESVSLLERCPHFRGCYVQSWDLKVCLC